MTRAQIQAVVAILKKRFQNLSAEETIELALSIIEAVEGKA